MQHIQIEHWVNGRREESASKESFTSINPSNKQALAIFPMATAADVDKAVAAARVAYVGWSQTPVCERVKILERFADGIEKNAERLGLLESQDVGKLLGECVNHDIKRASHNIRFFAQQMLTHTDEVYFSDEAFLNQPLKTMSVARRCPVGVAALIVPWNSPLMLATWKIGPCLATGNTCIIKPSPWASLTILELGPIAKEAGLPDGVLNVLTGGAECGSALVSHKGVDRVSFTGSVTTGRAVNIANSQSRMAPISLELGGKSPAVVFADCDFERAVTGVARGIFRSQGQSCVAGSRLIVEKSIEKRFLEALVAKVKAMKIGSAQDPTSEIGPLVTEQHFKHVEGMVERAKKEGCHLLCGGKEAAGAGYFYEPTIFAGVPTTSEVWREEVFGPVLATQSFSTLAEATALANDSCYGLSASIWTTNYANAHTLAHNIESGLAWINSHFVRDLRAPFGGVKESGIGQEGGRYSLEFYTQVKMTCHTH